MEIGGGESGKSGGFFLQISSKLKNVERMGGATNRRLLVGLAGQLEAAGGTGGHQLIVLQEPVVDSEHDQGERMAG